MPHFRVDDGLHSHPKARQAGLEAMGLWNMCGSYCMGYLTDGFVPEWYVKSWPKGAALAKRLVECKLWTAVNKDGEKGWQFHEFTGPGRNDTREQIEASRKKWRDKKAGQRGDTPPDSPSMSPGDTSGESPPHSQGDSPRGSLRVTRNPTQPNTKTNSGYVSEDDLRSERDPEFVADVPEFIESAAKPVKRHASSAAKTVVRQVLSHAGYPNSTLERLAVQVDKLAPNHPDSLIRQALTEWDQRPNCQRPEFLETVLGDLIKTSRAAPKTAAADEKVNGWLALAAPDPHTDSSPPKLHSDTRKGLE